MQNRIYLGHFLYFIYLFSFSSFGYLFILKWQGKKKKKKKKRKKGFFGGGNWDCKAREGASKAKSLEPMNFIIIIIYFF